MERKQKILESLFEGWTWFWVSLILIVLITGPTELTPMGVGLFWMFILIFFCYRTTDEVNWGLNYDSGLATAISTFLGSTGFYLTPCMYREFEPMVRWNSYLEISVLFWLASVAGAIMLIYKYNKGTMGPLARFTCKLLLVLLAMFFCVSVLGIFGVYLV